MLSYKVYLAKSSEAVKRIEHSFTVTGELNTDDILRVYHGEADGDERIPAIYYGKGYSCCVVELSENGENDAPEYELIIC